MSRVSPTSWRSPTVAGTPSLLRREADSLNTSLQKTVGYHHRFPKGFWICPGQWQGKSNVTPVANRVHLFPFDVNEQINISQVGFYVSTGQLGNIRIGVYASSPLTTRPVGSPLFSDTVTTATSGAKTQTCNWSLDPGLYWIATACQPLSTVPTVGCGQGFGTTLAMASTSEWNQTGGTTSFYLTSSYSSTLPAIEDATIDGSPTAGVPVPYMLIE